MKDEQVSGEVSKDVAYKTGAAMIQGAVDGHHLNKHNPTY
jgi:hypothetical protein